jgi:phosphoglycolate phosphatase-like HAD superfamily hydrolase
MINLAKEKFSLNDNDYIAKVGDSIIDIEEGKNAGCILNIGILTGAHTRLQLETANPDMIVASLFDLLKVF